MRLKFVKDLVEHLAGLVDDIVAAPFALLDELHMPLQASWSSQAP